MVGQEHEARLSKALLPRIGAAHLRKIADACRIDQSCVIKAIAHKKCAPRNRAAVHPFSKSKIIYMCATVYGVELKCMRTASI